MASSTQGRRVPATDAKRRALQVEVLDKPRGKRFDRMERLKYGGGVAAILLFGAATAWIFASFGKAAFAPGPVAKSHESFKNDCDACHTSGEPIISKVAASEKWATTSDMKCRACHPVAGLDSFTMGSSPHEDQFPIAQHSTREDKTKVQQCARCHHEHVGSQDLANLDNKTCTECHAALTGFVEGEGPVVDASIKQFDKEHPEFKSVDQFKGKDPGLIKFTHDRHMTAGLYLDNQRGQKKTWADVPEADHERLGRGDAELADVVQLSCRSCHEPSGRNMTTPTFENNCKSCHPLNFDGAGVMDHGLTASEIHRRLEELFPPSAEPVAEETKTSEDVIADNTKDPRSLPRPVTLKWPQADVAKRRASTDKIKQAEKELRGRCIQCHQVEDKNASDWTVFDVKRHVHNGSSLVMKKQWLQRARFDHKTHAARRIGCAECHTGAAESHDADQILIPDRQVCIKCHHENSADADDPKMNGGNSCLICHKYHNDKQPPSLFSIESLSSGSRASRESLEAFLDSVTKHSSD